MDLKTYLELIKHKKQTIISVLVLFFFLAVILTFIQPFRYSAQSSLLVVRGYTPGVDPYQVSKSNEYVAKVLAEVVNSGSFYNEAVNAGFNINRNYFTTDVVKQRKIWQQTVKASASDTGILLITVYHPDKTQADQIIRAIDSTMKSNHRRYHGAGDDVTINVIDQPFLSTYPVKPNIPINLLLAVLFGTVFGLSYIYLFPEKKFDLRILPSNRKKDPNRYDRNGEGSDSKDDNLYPEARENEQSVYASRNGARLESEYSVRRGAPDGSYSFYYHEKNQGEIPNRKTDDESKNCLPYEQILGAGRMENVLGA